MGRGIEGQGRERGAQGQSYWAKDCEWEKRRRRTGKERGIRGPRNGPWDCKREDEEKDRAGREWQNVTEVGQRTINGKRKRRTREKKRDGKGAVGQGTVNGEEEKDRERDREREAGTETGGQA